MRSGGSSCNIFWVEGMWGWTEGGVINEQTVFTLYFFIVGFGGPLVFILTFYMLVIIKLRAAGTGGQQGSFRRRKNNRKVN